MSLDVNIVPEGFKEAHRLLQGVKNGFPRATSAAINRGLITGRKVAVMRIRERYNIKARDLKGEGMKVHKATWTKMDGSLEARGPMLPVSLFQARSTIRRVGGKRKRFVTAAILKGGGRKLIKGAFQTRPGKIMERRQASRYPIFPVMTIGVPYMVRYQKISKIIQETIAKATAARLTHEVARLLNGPDARRISSPKL